MLYEISQTEKNAVFGLIGEMAGASEWFPGKYY